MPVVINEVIVRVTVDDNNTSVGQTSPGPPAGDNNSEAEIAEMVLQILKDKKER